MSAHGTVSGYQRHKRLGEPSCDQCRAANADYTRQRRATTEGRTEASLYRKARTAALARLGKIHPNLYSALYAEEVARAFRDAGLTPPGGRA